LVVAARYGTTFEPTTKRPSCKVSSGCRCPAQVTALAGVEAQRLLDGEPCLLTASTSYNICITKNTHE